MKFEGLDEEGKLEHGEKQLEEISEESRDARRTDGQDSGGEQKDLLPNATFVLGWLRMIERL